MRRPESEVEHACRQSERLRRGHHDWFRGGHQALAGGQPALNGRLASGAGAQCAEMAAMSLSHRAGQHRQRSSRDAGPCRDIRRRVMETRRRGDHRGESRRSEHDRDVDAVFRVRPRRLRPWRRGSGQPHLSVKVTTANTQRWLAGGGWRGDQPRHRHDPRVTGCRHDLVAEGDVAARTPAGQRRTRPVPVGVATLTTSG